MSGPPDQCFVCDSTAIQACSGCRQAQFCSEKCQRTIWPTHKYFCRLARKEPNPPSFSFPPLTPEEAAFFLPKPPDYHVPYTRDWRTEEALPWLGVFVNNGWWTTENDGNMAKLQKPMSTCSIPEPARSLALMELNGLYAVHHNAHATFTGAPWHLAGGECGNLIRKLYRFYWQKGEEPPPDLIVRISRLLHQDVIFHTIAVDQWIAPEIERLAA
ncbi:hypothetical protein JCM10021v2_000578 [Rhodotorula toruloides]